MPKIGLSISLTLNFGIQGHPMNFGSLFVDDPEVFGYGCYNKIIVGSLNNNFATGRSIGCHVKT